MSAGGSSPRGVHLVSEPGGRAAGLSDVGARQLRGLDYGRVLTDDIETVCGDRCLGEDDGVDAGHDESLSGGGGPAWPPLNDRLGTNLVSDKRLN